MKRLLRLAPIIGLIHCRDLHSDEELRAEPAPAIESAQFPAELSTAPETASSASPDVEATNVFVERYAEEDAYVVRGSKAKAQAILFGGQCAQPQGYIDAIKIAAARRTQLIALQGDAPCSGAFRGWSFDLAALSKRIDRTFDALGFGAPHDVLLIGYSQGALVAERLAMREPTKFTRFVLMASPKPLLPEHFANALAVATMAGTLDRQDLMQHGAAVLAQTGLRARYFPLPGARHGYMGTDPEGTFEAVFAWLDDMQSL